MLLRHALPTARSTFGSPLRGSRRTIFTEIVQTLSNAYLDLAVALPYPPTWPVYSSTIVILGVVSRLTLLPIFYWARKRERRVEDSVIPYLKAYRAKLEVKVQHEIDRSNNKATRSHFDRIVSEKLKQKRDELFKEHRCTPWVTMLVPTMTQIPIFVTISAVFFRAANGEGSVLRDEAFLTLPSLALPDPTATLPIVLGLVSLASIESSKWFATEEQSRRLAAQEKREQLQRAQGKIVIQPSKHVKSILRGLSVGRIMIAAMAPGSIEVYWLTSATFGLFQNWTMNWSDLRQEAQIADARNPQIRKEAVQRGQASSRRASTK